MKRRLVLLLSAAAFPALAQEQDIQRQLSNVQPDTPQELRPYERQKADEERRPLTLPSGGIVQPAENRR